jgi:ABC-2 type transport system permease protein
MGALQRIAQVVRKERLELWRNAGVVALILAIPVVELIVLGYAVAGSVGNLPAVVCDADRSAISRSLIQAIHQSRGFEVTEVVDDMARAERMLAGGEVGAVFIIPRSLEQGLVGRDREAAVAAVIDGSNTAVADYAAVYAEEIVGQFVARANGAQLNAPVTVQPQVRYNAGLRRENFIIPALLGAMLSLVVLSLTAVSIVRERERGTLEQLMVSPIRPLELVVGKLIPIVAIAYVELALMLLIAMRVFDVPVEGSLVLYGGAIFVYLLAEMGVGMLISTISRSQAQALPTIMLLVTTSAVLAGFFTPVEMMPPIAQWASALLPLRYFVAITRDLFAKGAGLRELAPHLLSLAGMGLTFFVASTLLLRRRLV